MNYISKTRISILLTYTFLRLFLKRQPTYVKKFSEYKSESHSRYRSFCPVTSCRPDSLPRGIASSTSCASLLVTFISLRSVLGWQSALLFSRCGMCAHQEKFSLSWETGLFFSCCEIIKNEWIRLNCRKHIYYLE